MAALTSLLSASIIRSSNCSNPREHCSATCSKLLWLSLAEIQRRRLMTSQLLDSMISSPSVSRSLLKLFNSCICCCRSARY
ncbi:GSCOCG00010474001-RA-CDS [Cotesia congregata]|nr:GSCOCG00010474001-RA-CDS [Cotesia congregata]